MLRITALTLCLITGSTFAQSPAPTALPESFHLVYEHLGRENSRLEVTLEKDHATLAVTLGKEKKVTDPFTAAPALWTEVKNAKLFTYKPETGSGAPDFGEVHLLAEATDGGQKSATNLSWNAPLRNDGQVWSLLNHLDGLMTGGQLTPLPAPSGGPVEAPGSVPAGPPASPIPNEPPMFQPAPPASPAAVPAPPAAFGAIGSGVPVASRTEAGQGQPGAVEALLASLSTQLPLKLVPPAPAVSSAYAASVALARAPALAAARGQIDARLALHPRSANLFAMRANVRLEQGDAAGAIADLSQAAHLEPHRADHRHNRGILHARMGHLTQARRDLEAAHELAPGRFQPAPLVLADAQERTWLGRPGRHLRAPRVDLHE